MKLTNLYRCDNATSAVEFGLTAPIFFMMMMGVIEVGLLMWAQLGLQHGVEMAARCASINTTICGSTTATQNYAAQNAFGLKPSATVFTASTTACGSQVTANYSFRFLVTYFAGGSLILNARSCYPK